MLGGIILASLVALMGIPVGPPALADAPVSGCYAGDPACFAVRAQPGVNVRSGPGTNYPVVGWLAYGTEVNLCQVMGENVGGNAIWDYVGNASPAFVADYWMNTPTYGTDPNARQYSCP
jgi:uncharacterized protein YraI